MTPRHVRIIGCHAEGEVGDVIVGGVEPPPGDTLWEQSRFVATDGALRSFVLHEPRGGVFRHVNLLVPPVDPAAEVGFIIMEPEHTPPMSGSNSICVATVVLETGIVEMVEPETRLVMEAPGGLVEVVATCHDGKVERVQVRNVASFADRLDAALEVEGVGTLGVDTAYGGDSFVFVDAEALGFAIRPDEAADLAGLGMQITAAANDQLGFAHPTNPDWAHISFCLFTGPTERGTDGSLTARNACAIEPGKVDRSPTGTALSARLALLHARGEIAIDEMFVARSIIGSEFRGRIVGTADVGGRAAVVPELSGRAWRTGVTEHLLDPSDPYPLGYRLTDTWPSRSS